MKVLRFGAVLLLGVIACGRGEEKAASPVVAGASAFPVALPFVFTGDPVIALPVSRVIAR